jgi:hypothetical protein
MGHLETFSDSNTSPGHHMTNMGFDDTGSTEHSVKKPFVNVSLHAISSGLDARCEQYSLPVHQVELDSWWSVRAAVFR